MSIHELNQFSLPPELAVDDEPLSPEDLADYFAVLDAGPTDGSETGEHAEAVERGAEVDRWRISNLAEAEWAMRKHRQAAEHLAELAAHRDEMIRRAQAWYSQASRADSRTAAFFAERLETWGVEQREAHPDRATFPLIAGTVKTTKAKPKVEVVDDEQLAEWLSDRDLATPDLVKWEAKVYVGPLRKLVRIAHREDGNDVVLTEDGELVPGVQVRPGEVTASVVPS